MFEQDLKSSAIKGAFWTALEKISRQVIQFIIGIILARLLLPEEFGIVGMLAIFIAVAQTFSDSGLASALIQKKDCSDEDYSTVFYFNVIVALCLYAVIFFTAPLIAEFYHMPVLKDVARVVALSIIISSFTTVQNTRLTKGLRFKEQSFISMTSMLATGIVGLVFAFNGFGVWALVFQALAGQVCTSISIWIISKWMPKFVFSKESFRQLWGFGYKILVSSLINTIYTNIYTLVIGRSFSSTDVGYFNRGKQFAFLPVQIVQDMAIKVNYPILAKVQDDNERLLRAYRKLMSIPLYLLYPILIGLATMAPWLIPLLIGDKWIPCVPILQILCLGYMFTPLTHLNLNLLYVKGRTDLVLKLELIKKPIAFLILFSTIPLGLMWMIAGKALYEFVAFSFNCYYTGKILGYGELKQLRVLLPIFINCAIMFIVINIAMYPFESPEVKLCIGIPTGIISYIIYSIATKNNCLKEIIGIAKTITKRI